MGQLRRGLRKFGKLSWHEQLLFSEACFLHLTTGLFLKIIPFRWIPRVFSNPQSAILSPQSAAAPDTLNRKSQIANRKSETSPLAPHSSILYQVRAANHQASQVSPWKNKCLVSSLAARRMLNRRRIPSQLSLGVAKGGDGKLIAHAWLKAGDFEIVEKGGDFSELYLF